MNAQCFVQCSPHGSTATTFSAQVIDNVDYTAVVGILVAYCTGVVVERCSVTVAALGTVACRWQTAAAVAGNTPIALMNTLHTRTCLTAGCVFCIGTSLGASSVNG